MKITIDQPRKEVINMSVKEQIMEIQCAITTLNFLFKNLRDSIEQQKDENSVSSTPF